MSLPPLNSVKRCPKCGEVAEKTRQPLMDYHSTRVEQHEHKKCRIIGKVPAEHICRECMNCDYVWPEACWVDDSPALPLEDE